MSLKNFSVLYVEDSPDMQDLMKSFLEDEVKEFYQAFNGEDGLAIYNEKKPDIILSDISMSKMSGLEMSAAIKKIDSTQPIVLLTAFEEIQMLKEAINIGVNNFIVKPIKDIKQLLNILEKISAQLQSKIDAKITEERLELALMGSNDGIWDWNISDNSVYFSPRWKDIIGYRDDELENIVENWESRIHPDDVEATWRGLQENIDKKTNYYEGSHRLRHKDGHWVWILDRGKALFDEDSKATRMIGTHTDITEEKKIQLKNAQRAQIIRQIHDCVISTDFEGNIESCNYGAERLLGYTKVELVGKPLSMLYPEEDIEQLQKNINILKTNGSCHAEVRLLKKSKDIIDTDLSLSLLYDEDNKPMGMIGYSQDITKRKDIEKKLVQEKETFEAIFKGSKDSIAILDMESNFLDVNPAYMEMTGMTKEELLSTSCIALSAPKDVEHSKKALKEAIKVGFIKNFEKDCLTKSGYITVNMSISVLSNPDRLLISVRDVTAMKNREKELHYLASIDPLTKLYNRRHFMKTSESILDLALRNKTDISTVMIDIDDFKNINDTYGHEIGDKVIISLALKMQELSRKSDIVSRWGGEEFLILLPNTNIDGAMVIAQKIRKAAEGLVLSIDSIDLKFTVSIGVSGVDIENESNIEASINRADTALYEAKESGKNKVCSKVVLV